jgi:ABC-type uncharacterized transport system involved in gliding motility auxiliary subunit
MPAAWVLANLVLGLALLTAAAAVGFDGLRERLRSGGGRRAGVHGTSAILQTVLGVAILGMLAFLSTRYGERFDWSEQKVNTLSEQTLSLLAELDGEVELTAFFREQDSPAVRDLLDRYAEASELVSLRYVDPNRRPDLVESYQVDVADLARGLLLVRRGDASVKVDEFGEAEITNALLRLTRKGSRVVYFLEGHNERPVGRADEPGESSGSESPHSPHSPDSPDSPDSPSGLSRAAAALRNETHRVEPLLLSTLADVPEDAESVVIAGPTRPFFEAERAALERYLARGGALLVMIDPRAQTNLYEDLRRWGVEMGDDVVVDPLQSVAGQPTALVVDRYAEEHPIVEPISRTVFSMARSVSKAADHEGLEPLVFASESSWAERDLDGWMKSGRAMQDEGDLAGPVPLAVAGTPRLEGAAGAPRSREQSRPAARLGRLAPRRRRAHRGPPEHRARLHGPADGRPAPADPVRLALRAARGNRPGRRLRVVVPSPGAATRARAMSPRATAWLLAATLALGAFVYFYEIRGEPGRRADAEARDRLFPDVAADAVEALRIQRPGEPETRAERGEGGWRLVAPTPFPADPASLSALVRALAEMRSQGRIDELVAPEVYGLGDDAILVSFTAGGRAHGLRIGREAPLGGDVYVGVVEAGGDIGGDAQAIHLTASVHTAAFDRGPDELRDRRLLDFEPDAVSRIAIEAPGLAAVLERREDGFEIVAPARLPADARAVGRLLSDLSQLRADSFVDEPSAEELRALAAARYAIELSGPEPGQRLRLAPPEEAAAETRLAEGREGRRYRVREALVAHLPDRLFALRDKRVARFELPEARAVELAFASREPSSERGGESGESVRVERPSADAAWSDGEGRAATEAFTSLLATLATLEAVDLVADSLGPQELRALGLAPPAIAIRVRGEAGLLAELHVGPPDEAGVLARAASGDASGPVYRLSQRSSAQLPASASDFRRDYLAELAELAEPAAPEAAAP